MAQKKKGTLGVRIPIIISECVEQGIGEAQSVEELVDDSAELIIKRL